MKKKIIILLSIFYSVFFGQSVFAQSDLIGQVLDAATKEPLLYVNIGLINKNIGTVSDDYGYFELDVNAKLNAQDTLLFSMIGFESKSFVLKDFLDQQLIEISLTKKATELDEVILTWDRKTKYQTKILGNKTTSKLLYAAFTTNKLGNEMGFVVRARKRPMILKKFNVSLVENDYGPIKFRLNFYDLVN